MSIGTSRRQRGQCLAAQATSAIALMAALPAMGSTTEGDPALGFGLQLRPPSLTVARRARHSTPRQQSEPVTRPEGPAASPLSPAAPPASGAGSADLGFDLLGPDSGAVTPVAVEDGRVKVRRAMLTLHPLFGIGLLGVETATVVVGQLNYNDRFGGGPSSARYEQSHKVLAYTTAGLFAATGLLAILAPNPLGKRHQGFDRVILHKICMFTAAAGMVTQIVLGISTAGREGYLNQGSLARAHLVIGYSTLAATYVGVGSIVF